MSVTVRPYRRGGWEVDVTIQLPNGQRLRERSKAPVSSKSAARRWGEDRERHLLLTGPTPTRKEVPTFEDFVPRFLDGHVRANREKPSGAASKERILRVHLLPILGAKRLDTITTEDVQRLKSRLSAKAPKTVCNILTVLNVMLKKAVEWDVLDKMPCTIRLLRFTHDAAPFHDFADYERLVTAAKETDDRAHLIVLLGGEAGLRLGEMASLKWTDVNHAKRQVCVQRTVWKGHFTVPKGGRLRYVPLTVRLAAALNTHRHLRGAFVLCEKNGQWLTEHAIQTLMRRAARRADLRHDGVHILRHTFCSHLAMKGAPARAIQELAGHKDLATTQRYMHLSPAALDAAIRLLESAAPHGGRGDILETGHSPERKVNE